MPLIYLVVRGQAKFLSGAVGFLGSHGVARKWMAKLKPEAQLLEEKIYRFYTKSSRLFIPIFALELSFHMAGVLEIYATLSFISPVAPTLRQAFILESVNRVINVAFKFIPLRVGVDEGGTGQVSKVLGLAKATGAITSSNKLAFGTTGASRSCVFHTASTRHPLDPSTSPESLAA